MSLQIEQKLTDYQFNEKQPKIYSIDVSLVTMRISVKGKERFIWVADDFKDDSFDTEGNCVAIIKNNDWVNLEQFFNVQILQKLFIFRKRINH
ncbi:MAG: hypothetical protein LBV69_09145 [Bacteroidales bacterium]|jgi:hypothetical protein|nr:hypothetical protein [Bacteroidales bacterium]